MRALPPVSTTMPSACGFAGGAAPDDLRREDDETDDEGDRRCSSKENQAAQQFTESPHGHFRVDCAVRAIRRVLVPVQHRSIGLA